MFSFKNSKKFRRLISWRSYPITSYGMFHYFTLFKPCYPTEHFLSIVMVPTIWNYNPYSRQELQPCPDFFLWNVLVSLWKTSRCSPISETGFHIFFITATVFLTLEMFILSLQQASRCFKWYNVEALTTSFCYKCIAVKESVPALPCICLNSYTTGCHPGKCSWTNCCCLRSYAMTLSLNSIIWNITLCILD